MHFKTLGPLEVLSPEVQLSIRGARQLALLSLLLIHPGKVVDTTVIIDTLWGDETPADPNSGVRFHIWKLRNSLEPERAKRSCAKVVVKENSGYCVSPDGHLFDSVDFESTVDSARHALETDPTASRALDLIDLSLGMWRGFPLVELRYHDLAQAEIRRLRELHLQAEMIKAEAMMALGRYRKAVPLLEAMAQEHPLTEPIWVLLITSMYHSGRPADALREYHRMETRLIEELGMEPSDALLLLRDQVLSHELI